MNAQDFANKLLDEIEVVSQAQRFLEEKTKQDYSTYSKALKYISQYLTHLWDLYYYYLNQGMMEVSYQLENSLNDLKNFNDQINREVQTLQQINKMITLISEILMFAFGLKH
jgi:hypothetical protein